MSSSVNEARGVWTQPMTLQSDSKLVLSSELTVRLIDHMGSDLSIAKAAWVSTKAEEAEEADPERIEGLISFLMKNRHGTPFEHNAMTFLVQAPIAVFREWHRHRIGHSYNEESGRYKQLRPHFYIPPPNRPLQQIGKPGHYEYVPGTHEQYSLLVREMTSAFEQTYGTYERLLEQGIAREVARGVLPVYIYSSMYTTVNARSLMAYLSLRTKDDDSLFPSFPMWEIDQCAQKVEAAFKDLFPITYSAFVAARRVAP